MPLITVNIQIAQATDINLGNVALDAAKTGTSIETLREKFTEFFNKCYEDAFTKEARETITVSIFRGFTNYKQTVLVSHEKTPNLERFYANIADIFELELKQYLRERQY